MFGRRKREKHVYSLFLEVEVPFTLLINKAFLLFFFPFFSNLLPSFPCLFLLFFSSPSYGEHVYSDFGSRVKPLSEKSSSTHVTQPCGGSVSSSVKSA